jgi:hypothetical protein
LPHRTRPRGPGPVEIQAEPLFEVK